MKVKIAWLLIPAILLFVYSCNRKPDFPGFEQLPSGLFVKYHFKSGDSLKPVPGQMIRVRFNKKVNDSIVESSEWYRPEGMEQVLRESRFSGSLEEGITLLAMGDSVTFMVNADSINKYFPPDDPSKMFEAGTYVSFDVKLMNIQSAEDVKWERENNHKAYVEERKSEEPKALETYIQDQDPDAVADKNGMIFRVIDNGNGPSPRDGDQVRVHYSGSFLDGTIFDSSLKRNEPFTFVVGDTGRYGVIEGWNLAVKKMNKGMKASVIIPSNLAYDSAGVYVPSTGKYFIPPYTTLKFDIELLEITTKQP